MMLKAIHDIDIDNKICNVKVEYSISKGLYCVIDGDITVNYDFLEKVKSV